MSRGFVRKRVEVILNVLEMSLHNMYFQRLKSFILVFLYGNNLVFKIRGNKNTIY